MSDFNELSRSVKGLTVLVTGAASGMGRATALVFATEGANVAVTDINAEATQAVADEIKSRGGTAKAWTLDVARADDITKVVGAIAAHFGGLDILINNAGLSLRSAIDDDGYEEAWTKALAVMLTAHPRIIRAALPHLRRSKCPRIVNIASTEALGATATNSPYAAAKAGVTGLTRALAVELGREGITVNCICPGPDPDRDHRADSGGAQDHLRQAPHRTRPLRRSRGGRAYDVEPVPAGGLVPHRRGDPGGRRSDGAECVIPRMLRSMECCAADPGSISPRSGSPDAQWRI
ncbi:SDR family NAD(P)-dependent oxidoreductase [Bradyrhizobium sp. LjRoot220]|uniref:SDR family NAD(P)-dependent oxidoreductase n=1 Tax=Bradyrhizobium sp. LjRoot220 TaxID=3342284 RepID=UPI003F509BB5